MRGGSHEEAGAGDVVGGRDSGRGGDGGSDAVNDLLDAGDAGYPGIRRRPPGDRQLLHGPAQDEQGGGDFPTDVGLTVGILPFEKIQAEIGVDLMEPSDHPLFFNAKVGAPEGVLFKGAPTIQLGVFNVGTKKDVTNQNIVDVIVGKTIANVGRVSVGYYSGNKKVLVDKDGKKANTGFMVAFDRGFVPAKEGKTEYNKFVLAADYASGKNALGAGGIGLYYYLTPSASILMGPVWFNEEAINGKWKWTTQLDVNF